MYILYEHRNRRLTVEYHSTYHILYDDTILAACSQEPLKR
jgi:hypothetical protein